MKLYLLFIFTLIILIREIVLKHRIKTFNGGICPQCGNRYTLVGSHRNSKYYKCNNCTKLVTIRDRMLNRIYEDKEKSIQNGDEKIKEIYLLTACEKIPNRINNYCGVKRIFGWYENIDDVYDDIYNCVDDIHDNIYNYLIIERVTFGIYPLSEERIWLEYVGNKWLEMDSPRQANTNVSYSIG